MTTTATKRAVGYVRVSTAEQAEDGYGLPVQRQAIVDGCRTHGYELVGIYEDAGVSGTLPWHDREGMVAALATVKERADDPLPVTALVVPRWDRLARDTANAIYAEREFMRHGAQVFSADGMNPEDETLRELMHVMASAERRALVARLRAGREAKRALGGRWPQNWRQRAKSIAELDTKRGVRSCSAYCRWALAAGE